MWPFRRDERSIENPSVSLGDPRAWAALFQSWHSASGAIVNVETALGVPGVWAAVNFIASTIASLPLQLFRSTDQGRDTADNDPVYALLHDAPNDEWTSYSWRKGAMQSVLLSGRAYTFIERNKAGRVMNLWPLDPVKTTVERRDGRTVYGYQDADRRVTYQAHEIIDIVWMRKSDGITHYDPVERLRNAIGAALAMEEYAAKFFQNSGVPPLQLVGPLASPAAITRAGSDIVEALRAATKEHRPILPMPFQHELKPIGFDPEKGQMIEARLFQLQEIARIYQLPPTFLQDLSHGTFSNTEQQDLHFVKHTLTQWLECWEQELNLKLFSRRNRKNFVEFNIDGLLRGDFKVRMDGYAQAIQHGINTPDEVRDMENWRRRGGAADGLFMQGAMMPIDRLGQQPTAPEPPEPEPPESEADDQA